MKVKRLIIVSIILIVSGFLISLLVLVLNQFDISKLDDSIISKTYSINGDFNSIECDLDVSSLNIYYTKDSENKASCLEKENITFDIKVENGILKIKENNNAKWYDNINFTNNTAVSLFINKEYFDNLIIKTDTGDISILESIKFGNINIEGSTASISFMGFVEGDFKVELSTGDVCINKSIIENLNIKVSTGNIDILESEILDNLILKSSTGDMYLSDCLITNKLTATKNTGRLKMNIVTCDNLEVSSRTGDTILNNVVINHDANIESTTGDVKFNNSDAKNIYINTSTGDVTGSIMSHKIFNVKTDTGKVVIPENIEGVSGLCNITTDTGDIKIYYN